MHVYYVVHFMGGGLHMWRIWINGARNVPFWKYIIF